MYIERTIIEKFNKLERVYNSIAIVGPRQSGKTTFLKESIKQRNSAYVLFDDPDARSIFEDDIKRFERQYMEGYDLTILDEIQNCKNAGSKLKYLVDNGKRIYMTSSSEILLSKEILSYLVGRVSIIRLYPLSLKEFLSFKGHKEVTELILKRDIWEHITYGGYPKVVITDDIETKKIILRDLYDTMVLKDIARTFSIEDINSLEEFIKYLATNTSNIISYESLSSNLKISFKTIKKYLNAAEKSYLTVRIRPFFKNKSKELIKQPKIYFIDVGLRNEIAREFKKEVDGSIFENYILSELIKLGFTPKYWKSKSKAEVDFIIEKNNEVIPIEVKVYAEPNKIERGLRSFIDLYKPKTALVVTYKGEKGEMKVGSCRVKFVDVLEMNKLLINEYVKE